MVWTGGDPGTQRRSLLAAGLAGVAGMRAGLPGQRPDQRYVPPVTPAAPGTRQQVVGRVIIASSGPGSGLFEYSGTPGPGNPPIAYAAAPSVTTDPYGNTLPTNGGFVSVGALGAFAQLLSAGLHMLDTTGGTQWELITTIIGMHSFIQIADVTSQHSVYLNDAGALVAEHPGSFGTPETWQVVPAGSLAAGFAIGSTPIRYRKEIDNTVRLAGVLNLTASQTAPVDVFQVAPGYIPAQNQFVVCANQLSGAVATQTVVEIDTTGFVSLLLNGVSGNTVSLDNVSYPLD